MSSVSTASSSKKQLAKASSDDNALSSSSGLSLALMSKALTPDVQWQDKDQPTSVGNRPILLFPTPDEFLDVIYWMRQILGIILGLVWGVIPLKGFIGLALFLLVNVAIVYLYYNNFQKIDEEEYGGATEILKEGLMTSFSSFLVAWIILYSALHSGSPS